MNDEKSAENPPEVDDFGFGDEMEEDGCGDDGELTNSLDKDGVGGVEDIVGIGGSDDADTLSVLLDVVKVADSCLTDDFELPFLSIAVFDSIVTVSLFGISTVSILSCSIAGT